MNPRHGISENYSHKTIFQKSSAFTSRAINGVGQSAGYDALGRVTVWTNALGSFTNVYVGATKGVSS